MSFKTACDGRCCVVLHITKPVDKLRAEGMNGNSDSGKIARMLRPITVDQARDRTTRYGLDGMLDETQQHYRCKWWDEQTMLCTNYEERPSMCRQYPYGAKCVHCGLEE